MHRVLPKTDKYLGVPPESEWNFSDDAEYVYYCSNETVGGEPILFSNVTFIYKYISSNFFIFAVFRGRI